MHSAHRVTQVLQHINLLLLEHDAIFSTLIHQCHLDLDDIGLVTLGSGEHSDAGVYAVIEDVLIIDLLIFLKNVPLIIDYEINHEIITGLEIQLQLMDLDIEPIVATVHVLYIDEIRSIKYK